LAHTSRYATKKILIAALLVALVAMSSSQLCYSPIPSAQGQGNGSNSSEDLSNNNLLAPDPYASPRSVNESAIGLDAGGGSGRTVNLPGPGTSDVQVNLDHGWSSSKVTATVLGLWDQRNWLINGSFNTGQNTPHSVNYSAPWFSSRWYDTHKLRGSGGSNATVDQAFWVSSGNSKYVSTSMPWVALYGNNRQYYPGEYAGWNETFVVPRGNVIAANLNLTIHPNFDTGWFSLDSFKVVVYVNNHRVFQDGFAQINSAGQANIWTKWSNINVLTDVNDSSVFNSPAQQTMTIMLAVIYDSHLDYFGGSTWTTQNGCWFDNVTLALKAYARPDQLQLQFRRPSGAPSTNVVATGWGSGTATLTGFTIGPATMQTTYYFGFTSNVTYPVSGSFTSNASVYVTGGKTATTAFISQGSIVNWSVSFVTTLKQSPESVSTTSYSSYYFNVSIQKDWNLTTCTDPSGYIHDIKTDPNFSNKSTGSLNILKVNVAGIGSYSQPPNYYPYVIHAVSNNYVKYLVTKLQSGPSWINAADFYPTQTARFVAYIKGSSPVSSGIANLTLRGPPTYNASPVVVKTVVGVTPSSGWANFTMIWNGTNAAGNYTGQVDWVDNNLGEAGTLTCNFNITHRFTVAIGVPAAGDVILKGTRLENPPTSVSVRDYYTGQFVRANVTGITSWEKASSRPWVKFTTFSELNATYTNVTIVPSTLGVGSTQWLAANVTDRFYDPAYANNSFWIGTAANINPSTQNFNIYFAEAQSFNIHLQSPIFYSQTNGTRISGATITLSASISSNDTLVQWNSRFTADLSQNGTGYYSGSISIGTFSQSVKAIPPGTYTVWFRLYKDQYTQTQYSKLQLTVYVAPSYLYSYSGDGQSVFWGSQAALKLNFTTSWSISGYTLPRTPILNSTAAPCYAPPYVSIAFIDWTGGWTATHLLSDPDGIYTVYIDTTAWTTPTPDGSGSGTVVVSFRFIKDGYILTSVVSMTIHIRSLTTSETGAIQQLGGYTLTNTTSTYPGDTKSIFVWYNDTHSGLPIGIGGASVTYTSSGGTLGSGALVGVTGKSGLYNLTLTGVSTDQIPGTYYVYVAASKGAYYVQRNITITLNILALPTDLHTSSPSVGAYYLDRVVFLIWFNDTHNGVPIDGATMSVTAPGVTLISPFEVPGHPGLWNLTIPGGQGVGHYSITLQASKAKYTTDTETLTLDVNSLPTVFSSYIVTSGGQVLIQHNGTIPQGQALTIYLWFNDTHSGLPVSGIASSITYTSAEFGNGWVTETTTPGLYKVTFQTPDAGIFDIIFTVSSTGYQSQSITFHAIVQAPPPGFSVVMLALVGFGGGGIVIAAVAAMIFIRRARMPFIIKKINETLGLINKGEHEQATPVPLKSRDEAIAGIMTTRIESFGKRKPSKEEEAEAGVELAPPPPSPETSAALKEELKAVEGKEKPEEGIEEVEMDTLDEQLQQLEKVETKENLPDGAKEVRDVIEKYKEGKKKKK
jgi:hypothetical protein